MTATLRRSDVVLAIVLALVGAATAGIWGVSPLLGLVSAVLLMVWMLTRSGRDGILDDDRTAPVLLVLPVVVAAASTAISPETAFVLMQNALPAALVAVAGLVTMRYQGRVRTAALMLGLVLVVVGSSLWIAEMTRDGKIDIVFAHEAAAEALVRGENPYEVVRIENTSPYGDHGPIVGYPYPPVSLISYAAPAIVIPVQAVAAMYVIILVVVVAWSGYSIGRFDSSFTLAAVVAGVPAMGFMLFSAATEGFTSLLFLVSGVLWRRRPIASAILVGLAIASKQYLVVPAFALLLADVDRRWMRIGVGIAAAVLATFPFLVWDPGSLIGMLGVRGSGWEFRPDAISIGAFGIALPTAVVVVVALLAMAVVRKGVAGPGSFFFVAATGLGVMLAIHPHSFANHWFGLLVLIVTGIVTTWRGADEPVSGPLEEATT